MEYLEQHKDSSPFNFLLQKELSKLSKDRQSVSSINTSKGPKQQTPLVVANKYVPLALPIVLNPMPDNYNQRIK